MSSGEPARNWAGNVTYGASRIHEPREVDELQELVRRSSRIRALGTRHAFNELADGPGDLISLRRLPRRLEIDPGERTVTIDGGQTYGELAPRLQAAGLALHNLASLPHISVAGACATSTHGSGDRLGSLATAVTGLELVRADGELVRIDDGFSAAADDVPLEGAVVGLGALGVVTGLTLHTETAYDVRQTVLEDVGFDGVIEQLDAVTAAADSVSLFTDWSSREFHQVWLKRRADQDQGRDLPIPLRDARRSVEDRHPIRGMPPEACTPQLGVPGPWHERLPHFRLDHVPSAGDELQSEYLLPRAIAADALVAVQGLADRLAPLVWVSEIRTVAADGLWLSPAFERDSLAIHFTWRADWPAVEPVMRAVERRLEPFGPRPHWGKLFGIDEEAVRAAYPRRPALAALQMALDPSGRFRNRFTEAFVLDA